MIFEASHNLILITPTRFRIAFCVYLSNSFLFLFTLSFCCSTKAFLVPLFFQLTFQTERGFYRDLLVITNVYNYVLKTVLSQNLFQKILLLLIKKLSANRFTMFNFLYYWSFCSITMSISIFHKSVCLICSNSSI